MNRMENTKDILSTKIEHVQGYLIDEIEHQGMAIDDLQSTIKSLEARLTIEIRKVGTNDR